MQTIDSQLRTSNSCKLLVHWLARALIIAQNLCVHKARGALCGAHLRTFRGGQMFCETASHRRRGLYCASHCAHCAQHWKPVRDVRSHEMIFKRKERGINTNDVGQARAPEISSTRVIRSLVGFHHKAARAMRRSAGAVARVAPVRKPVWCTHIISLAHARACIKNRTQHHSVGSLAGDNGKLGGIRMKT